MECVLLGTGWWLPMIPAVEVPVKLLVAHYVTVLAVAIRSARAEAGALLVLSSDLRVSSLCRW